MNLASVLEREILPIVDKPSRWLGNEVNSVHKRAGDVEVRLALVFPDLYDLGLGNLGLHILYAIVNRLPWAWCERAYAPSPDLEVILRERGLPLFALESKEGLGVFDGLGFTLQSELTYTNILNILDLAGLPLRAASRGDAHPLVFAGGPSVFNPEPLAPFMDFFVIGDGEDVILEIAEVLRGVKGRPRQERLEALARLEGVYVPALYPFEVLESGAVVPALDAPKIRKRLTADLNGATFPTDYIVPFTGQDYDRVSLEVLRGCTQGCRFCAAGMTTRPVRERKIEKIDELMRRTLESTGYEEVSLVSLSTCDYSQVQRMVQQAATTARELRAAVLLPSLRLDSFSVELADMVAETRKSGITFAPEAATPRLRAVINKFIPDDELLQMSAGAFGLGWDVIKLYFMIGLPTERDEDIEAIADLAARTLAAGRKLRSSARVNLGVSTFVPKPFTPFQWAAQIDMAETDRRQAVLAQGLRRHRAIKFGRHDARETFIEGLLARSDRRAADLLEAAFRHGARFDAWHEHIRLDAWERAIEETGFDVADALRERRLDERLPWDHIDVLIDKSWLQEDWLRAELLQWAPDCRKRKCHKCGVIDHERELCASMLRDNVKGRREEKTFVRAERPVRVEPPVAQRLWVRFGRTGMARFISHLETASVWARALRRARVPVSWDRGIRPRPRIHFSDANPTGQETTGDYMDLCLSEPMDPLVLLDRLRATLPEGFTALSAREVPRKAPAVMALATGGLYTLTFPGGDRLELAGRLAALRQLEEIPVELQVKRRGHKRRALLNVRPMLLDSRLYAIDGDPALDMRVVTVGGKLGRPQHFLDLLCDNPDSVRVLKRDSLYCREGLWRSLDDWAPAEDGAEEALLLDVEEDAAALSAP